MARIVTEASPKINPKPAARSGKGWYILGVICLVQFALIGGWAAGQYFHVGVFGSEHASSEKKDDEASEELKPSEPPTVPRGDTLLKEGRYDLALKMYEPLAATATGSLRGAIQYRVGLCEEGLGRPDRALRAYRLAARADNPRIQGAAEVGQARVLIRQRKPAEARDILYPLLLRSGTPELRDQAYLGDVRYLIALTLALEVLKPEKPGPLSDNLADYTAADWPVEEALVWAGAESETQPDKAEKPDKPGDAKKDDRPNFIGSTRSSADPGSMRISATVAQDTVAHLVERLAERAQLKVQWSDAAKKLAEDRNATVILQDMPVSDVLLDLVLPLADPLRLVATLQDKTLRLATEAETEAEAVTAYRTTMAKRALNAAILNNPGHRLTAAASLELGNLEARTGSAPAAIGRYERLISDYRLTRTPLVVEANYNLGMVRMKIGLNEKARQAFFAARDHSPGHELAPLALFQIGRSFLYDGEPAQATKPLREALALSQGTPIEPAAAVTLAAAHLLNDAPKEASRAVREHREPVGQPPYRATAFFLDTYGTYLAVSKGKASAHEASDLLAALWGLGDKETALGPIGPLLIGRAYRDLDRPEDMIAVYKKALPAIKGPLAGEMSYQVAEDYYRHNNRAEARKLYLPLAKEQGGRWTVTAQLRLAHIALDENRPQETLQMCRKLLEDKQPPKREEVLLLMGNAYQQSGEFKKAAHCFEGKIPE